MAQPDAVFNNNRPVQPLNGRVISFQACGRKITVSAPEVVRARESCVHAGRQLRLRDHRLRTQHRYVQPARRVLNSENDSSRKVIT
jgi:hypothetical protein